MKVLALFLIAFCACLVLSKRNYNKDWKKYKKEFEKSYSPREDAQRKKNFIKNVKQIEKHNREARAGKQDYYLGWSFFTDMSDEEMNGIDPCTMGETDDDEKIIYRSGKDDTTKKYPHLCASASSSVPRRVNWDELGHVTPPQSQGKCGACYAFATMGALEAQLKAKTGKLTELSKQILVDCSDQTGNKGCKGGFLSKGFQYVKNKGGTVTEKEDPYTAKKGTCKELKPTVKIDVKKIYYTGKGTEDELKKAVGTVGPVVVGIPVTKTFRQYKNGLFMDPECATKKPSHAVLVVGYDTLKNGSDYWIIKNSWGQKWGKKGFMYMKRNSGICKIGSNLAYPIL